MWPFRKRIEKCIGSETDTKLKETLKEVLQELGGEYLGEEDWVVGSQGIVMAGYRVAGRELTVTVETYEGIVLSGDKDLVNAVEERVRSSLRGC